MSEYNICRACGSTDAHTPFFGNQECPNKDCSNFSQRQYDAVYGMEELPAHDDTLETQHGYYDYSSWVEQPYDTLKLSEGDVVEYPAARYTVYAVHERECFCISDSGIKTLGLIADFKTGAAKVIRRPVLGKDLEVGMYVVGYDSGIFIRWADQPCTVTKNNRGALYPYTAYYVRS